MGAVVVTSPALAPIDTREVLRYAGVRSGSGEELLPTISELYRRISPILAPKACYVTLPVSVSEANVRLGDIALRSESLAGLLCGCSSAIIFAATVGIALDREIARLGAVSPAKQLIADAIGNERIEALCESLCASLSRELSARGKSLTRRFSAGYGDLPLRLQGEIFSLLDCPRRIGLTLNGSLLMSPSKSVSAIMGVR